MRDTFYQRLKYCCLFAANWKALRNQRKALLIYDPEEEELQEFPEGRPRPETPDLSITHSRPQTPYAHTPADRSPNRSDADEPALSLVPEDDEDARSTFTAI